MTQGRIDWDASVSLPIAGRTPATRHASATGAQAAAPSRGRLSVAYLELLRVAGPLSDHAAAKALGCCLSSVNSTRNGLGGLVEPSGEFESSEFGTRRVRWRRATAAERSDGSVLQRD